MEVTISPIQIQITGVFWTLCAALGLYMLFKDNKTMFEKSDNFKETFDSIEQIFENFFGLVLSKLNFFATPAVPAAGEKAQPRNYAKGIAVVLIFLSFSYMSGMYMKSMSGNWMDNGPLNHIGLKCLWARDSHQEPLKLKGTSSQIVVNQFKNTFVSKECQNADANSVNQLFNYLRYRIFTDKEWNSKFDSFREDILISAGIGFAFFTLLVLSLINYLIYSGRLFMDTYSKYRPVWLLVLIYGLSLVPAFYITVHSNGIKILSNDMLFNVTLLTWCNAVWVYSLVVLVALIVNQALSNFKFFIPVLFVLFSLGGYYVSARAWVYNHAGRDLFLFNIMLTDNHAAELRKLYVARWQVNNYCMRTADKAPSEWKDIVTDTDSLQLQNLLHENALMDARIKNEVRKKKLDLLSKEKFTEYGGLKE